MVRRREFVRTLTAGTFAAALAPHEGAARSRGEPAGARRDGATSTGPMKKRFVQVRGARMAAVDTGLSDGSIERPTLVFLHGNPTSSYLWRNIIDPLGRGHRCVAPDLIGFGDSDKLAGLDPQRYRYAVQRDHLDGLLDALGVGSRVVLVLHDWGGMLGFDWARRHEERVAGIAHMETVMDGLSTVTAPPGVADFFLRYRTPAGEREVLQENQFVERVLIRGLGDALTDEDREEYRRPFREPGEGRRATLTWPQQVPVDGAPPEVESVVLETRGWLATSAVPKLFINVTPGALLADPRRKAICRSWPNTTEAEVRGNHYVQEQSPAAIAAAIAAWLPHVR